MARRTELVGILNITPDSFSDGGQYFDPELAAARAQELFKEGASLVDVGGESTRPGATPITADEEWQRLEAILSELVPSYPDCISLDTRHPAIVSRAAEIGAVVINDVTAFSNPEMIEVAAYLGFRCIVSHLPNSAGGDIQRAHTERSVDSVDQVRDELLTRREQLIAGGIRPGSIILDPGIGFGKTIDVNWRLLTFAGLVPECEVMVGYSRKRFIGKDLGANLEAARMAIQAGTRYLRVHDVAPHYELLRSLGQL